MVDRKSEYTERIQQLRPDLQINSIDLNTDGLLNDVVIVNQELVFRFAKNEHARATLAVEATVLQHLSGRLSIMIPLPTYVGEDVLVYPLIEGDELTRAALFHASEAGRQRLMEQLGRFLKELHSTPLEPGIPETLAPVTHEAWQEIRSEVEEKVFPWFMPHQIDWAERLLDGALGDKRFFEYEPKLIHGDLAPYHILFRADATGIRGVIDFGVAGVGDPANDLAMLLQSYGENVVDLIFKQYPEGRSLMQRARFYAQAIELQWALLGIKTGDNLWFLAHIGGARDVGE